MKDDRSLWKHLFGAFGNTSSEPLETPLPLLLNLVLICKYFFSDLICTEHRGLSVSGLMGLRDAIDSSTFLRPVQTAVEKKNHKLEIHVYLKLVCRQRILQFIVYCVRRQNGPCNTPRRQGGGVEVELYSFLTSTPDGGGCQRRGPAALLPVNTRYPFLQEVWWVPGPVWTGVEKV